jgi:hypothetical protein
MMDDTIWTQPKRLTFFGRLRLTYALSKHLWPIAGGFLKAVWPSGATVSLSQTTQHIVSANIVSQKATLTVATAQDRKSQTVTVTTM